MAQPRREYECPKGHKWQADVQLSPTTTALSGERVPCCPTCGKRAAYASPYLEDRR